MSSRPLISKKRVTDGKRRPESAPMSLKLRQEIAGTFQMQARREEINRSGKTKLPRHKPSSQKK